MMPPERKGKATKAKTKRASSLQSVQTEEGIESRKVLRT